MEGEREGRREGGGRGRGVPYNSPSPGCGECSQPWRRTSGNEKECREGGREGGGEKMYLAAFQVPGAKNVDHHCVGRAEMRTDGIDGGAEKVEGVQGVFGPGAHQDLEGGREGREGGEGG